MVLMVQFTLLSDYACKIIFIVRLVISPEIDSENKEDEEITLMKHLN